MLALHRLRCLLHSVPTSQTRYLRTQPREIPSYARRWDPTQHTPLRPKQGASKPYEPLYTPEHGLLQDATDDTRGTVDGEPSIKDIAIVYTGRAEKTKQSIRRLQHILNQADAKDHLDLDWRTLLWKAYSQAKRLKATLPAYLPQRAWRILWKSQSMDYSDMERRKVHLSEINHDILVSKAAPIAAQVAYHIERKFMAGNEQQALEKWETSRHSFGTAPEYLDVGVRLHALAGFPERARAIMNHLLELDPDWDPSVMMAVFRAYTSSDLEQHHKTAKEIYHAIKAKLGASITIETFDSCMVGFLEARSVSGAKEAFRDMIRGGHLSDEPIELHVDEVLRRLNLMYALGTDVSRMTSIALDAIRELPPAFHGHIFGDWMKSAVVQKLPQAAAQILDMMIHRGYEPDSFHFNMLLRALLRTKDSPDVLKAENLGWKMVEEARLLMQTHRPTPKTRKDDIDKKAKLGSVLDAKPTIAVPAASVTTFALIMRHHAQNSQWEHVDYLARQLKLANIQPNVSIMNVLIDNKCRQGKYAEAWQIYQSLTDKPDASASVFPDGESIRCLWKTLRIALADATARQNPDLPTPRKLLRETVRWWSLCRSRYDADRFLQGLAAEDRGAITTLILHCFSYTQDLAGSLVALHVLRHKFGIHPTEKAAEIVQKHVAWVDLDSETESVRMQFGQSQSYAKNLDKAVYLYQQILQRRREAMTVTTETIGPLFQDNIKDLELEAISDFIRIVMIMEYPADIVEMMIGAARKVVGVPNLPTGKLSAVELE